MDRPPRPQSGLERIRPYVPGRPIDEVKRSYGLNDVIKLASNENPLGVSPLAEGAIRRSIPGLNLYPDGASYELRKALSDKFSIPIDSIAVGNGADGLILQISLAYLDQGDAVIVSRSSFPMYDIYAHAMRARLVKTELASGYRINLPAMAEAIDRSTKIVYVCNPNNPTGTIVTRKEVERFLDSVPARVLIVFDEAYYEMVDSPDYPDTLAYIREGRENIIVLRTFSKVYGLAGIRLGYAFGDPDLISPLFKVKPPFSVNSLAQAGGIAALADEGFLRRSVEANRREREFLYQGLDRLGLEYARSHTNFILVRVGPDAAAVQEGLLRQGVIVRPCTGYDLPEHLRISVGTRSENERLLAGLEVLVG